MSFLVNYFQTDCFYKKKNALKFLSSQAQSAAITQSILKRTAVYHFLRDSRHINVTAVHWFRAGTALTALRAPKFPAIVLQKASAIRMPPAG